LIGQPDKHDEAHLREQEIRWLKLMRELSGIQAR
tara:strand:+ start:329 stop:430 length:102 start_codon:yes stop_codon:yes gene_type:complete